VKNPYHALLSSGWSSLARMGWQKLKDNHHGDFQGWSEIIAALPEGKRGYQLDCDAPVLGEPVADQKALSTLLMGLHPWRKGPLVLGGVRIDSEWRSDWKWRRLAPRLDLSGHAVLDIGCGNGYYGLRMLGAGAKQVIGIDPTLVFVMQWLAMHKILPGLPNFVLLLGIEDLPVGTGGFDSVFSMGVLYHRRQPLKHLGQLRGLVRPGGQIVLETLILPDRGENLLQPLGRYARMPNVHAVPSLKTLQNWIKQAGLPAAEVLDISKTSQAEQRRTDWMKFESLAECLDAGNESLTVEGHPAPVRAALLIKLVKSHRICQTERKSTRTRKSL